MNLRMGDDDATCINGCALVSAVGAAASIMSDRADVAATTNALALPNVAAEAQQHACRGHLVKNRAATETKTPS